MITVDQLSYAYPGATVDTLHNLAFDVADGEIFGLLGPSGAGKSTTVNLLIGLLTGARGVMRVLGHELQGHDAEYYERIGVGFEFPNVYTRLTARENLAFFASLYRGPTAAPLELLEQVGLGADADKRVSEFSKGMKLRLNFCRALVGRPELLFLDEPTSGQDPANAARLRELIRQLQATGRTVLLTTHDMHVAADLCDRVGFMVDGRITLIGAPRDLMLSHGQRLVRVEYRTNGDDRATSEFDLDGLSHNAMFQSLLAGGSIETIHTLEATLEDVFLQETGRSLQ